MKTVGIQFRVRTYVTELLSRVSEQATRKFLALNDLLLPEGSTGREPHQVPVGSVHAAREAQVTRRIQISETRSSETHEAALVILHDGKGVGPTTLR